MLDFRHTLVTRQYADIYCVADICHFAVALSMPGTRLMLAPPDYFRFTLSLAAVMLDFAAADSRRLKIATSR